MALKVASFGSYTFAFGLHEAAGFGLMASGYATATYHAQDIKAPNITWENADVYVPDRPLPVNEHGVSLPETDAPHTVLGTRNARKGKYPQAREFDKKGKPIRDFDFTDHGYPNEHTNPHQHRRDDNQTGGTRSREDAEPLSNWKYK